MPVDLSPDPSRIGPIAEPPFAVLPDPARVFARRAERLTFLAGASRLAPYLRFLARALPPARTRLAAELPAVAPLTEARIALARESADAADRPPLARRLAGRSPPPSTR